MTNDVKIFAKTIEQEATEQIEKLSHHPVSDGSKVRIMPDVHAGAGCTIGTTMTIHDRVCPNLVGVDIGCGMLAVKLGRCGGSAVRGRGGSVGTGGYVPQAGVQTPRQSFIEHGPVHRR